MVALINNDLANAMDRLERRILSLNYNGYFTRNFFSELKDILELWVAFRIHASEESPKFHSYGQHDEYVEKFMNLVYSSLAGEEKKLRVLLNTLKVGEPSFDVRTEKIEEPITVKDFGPAQVRDHNRNMLPVQTKIDIPLWVKHCSTCEAFLEYNETSCPNCDNSSLSLKLRGIIRLYSCLGQEDLLQLVNGLGDGQGDFGQRICRLFARQEQPDCFTTYTENKTDCEKCRYKDHCSLVMAKDKKDPLHSDKDKDPLSLDEVLHQLQEKCGEILGLDYELPILVYDAKERNLKYSAIDYLTPPPSENFFGIINTIKNKTDIKNKITEAAKQVSQVIKQEVDIVFESSDTKKITEKIADAVRQIFKTIIQRIDTGETKYVWHTWGNLEILSDGGLLADVSKDKIEFDIDHFDKKLKDCGDDSNEILRVFAEALFFTGLQDAIVLTPLGYMGQKHGLIFTMIRKRPGENSDRFSQRLREVEDTFSRIAREFAALLFHSLEYQMYDSALEKLKDSSINQVPNILLDVFPTGFNLVAGAFWNKTQIDGKDLDAPCFLHAFRERESDSKDPPKMLGPEGLNLCPLMDLKDEKQDFFKDELAQNSDRISACWKTKKTIVDRFTSKTGAKVYGDGDEKNKKKLDIRSRLLVPVGTADDQALPSQLSGVFDLYFDQSHYVLHRHALDLAREIRFVFTQTANAAEQKHEVIQKGINAAVAAIMARNFDHNLGGHLLSYLTYSYHEWAGNGDTEFKKVIELEDLNARKIGFQWFLKNNSYLLKYLKDRMDFIATILTFVPSCSTMNLPDNLIGPGSEPGNIICLNYDYKRVKNSNKSIPYGPPHPALKELGIKHFTPKNFVLNYLAFSEHLKGERISRDEIMVNLVTENTDIRVALPGGVIGKQAFYAILENIIRNAAKNIPQDVSVDKLVFSIDFPDEYANPKTDLDYDKDDLLRITVTDNLCNGTVADELQKKCESPIVNMVDGGFERKDLGLKEMKICAGFLRGYDPKFIEANELKGWPNGPARKILQINNWQNNLQYCFFVLKPKEILIATDDSWVDDHKINELKKYGVDFVFVNKDKSLKKLKANYKLLKLRYRFILLDCKNDVFEEVERDFLPLRVITLTEENNFLKTTSPENLLKEVYKRWLKILVKKKGLTLPSLVIFPPDEKIAKKNWNDKCHWYDTWDKELSHDEYSCIFFNHFEDHVQDFKNDGDLLEGMEKKKAIHIEAITGSNSSKRKIENPGSPELMKWELIEAGLTKVLIIDERFFDMSRQKEQTEPFLKARGIDLWDFDKNEATFYSLIEGLEMSDASLNNKLIKYPSVGIKEYDFIVLHQGIVDKLLDAVGLGKNAKNIKKALGIFSMMAKFRVVHSGRGKTEDIPEGWRFLPYSELESWFFEDKHSLVQGLFSLRGR